MLLRDFCDRKTACLISCQNSTMMSVGLNEADYERLIYLVSRNRLLHDASAEVTDDTPLVNDTVHPAAALSSMLSSDS